MHELRGLDLNLYIRGSQNMLCTSLEAPRPFLGVQQSNNFHNNTKLSSALLAVLTFAAVVKLLAPRAGIKTGTKLCKQLLSPSLLHTHSSKPTKSPVLHSNILDEAIKTIFMKSQPSSRCPFNILCDRTGSICKAG